VWRHLIPLLLAAGLTFFVGLGRAAITDSDEAFYAEAAREMVESGDWLTPRYNYVERFEKPALYYWLAAGLFQVAGPNEVAARLPAAASGLLLVLATWACGRRWCGERAGLLAGLVTATNFGYFAMARLALPDLPLAALMVVATWAAIEAAGAAAAPGPAGRPGAARWWMLLSASAGALAFLMKGPVGVALPALTVVAATWLGLLGPKRLLPVPVAHLAIGALAFGAIAIPWFAAMADAHGIEYLERFFVAENLERFATDRYNEPRSLFYFVPITLGGLLPWSPFLALGVAPAVAWVRRRATPPAHIVILVLWAAVPFVFFSLSVGKQPRYILPILPPLAILIGCTLQARLDPSRWPAATPRLLAWLGALTAAIFVVLGLLLYRARPLLAAIAPGAGPIVPAIVVATGVGVGLTASRWPLRLVWSVAAASIVTLLCLHFTVFSAAGAEPVEQMAHAYAQARGGSEPSATHRVFVRNFVFYTGVAQTDLGRFEDLVAFLGQPERVFCVIRARDLAQLKRDHDLTPRVHGSVAYFNIAGLRLATLLRPDPANDLEPVHLVSNH
jgi:4-amino-4-deoxy-L-arabinose transferase-like glycosyltransferase